MPRYQLIANLVLCNILYLSIIRIDLGNSRELKEEFVPPPKRKKKLLALLVFLWVAIIIIAGALSAMGHHHAGQVVSRLAPLYVLMVVIGWVVFLYSEKQWPNATPLERLKKFLTFQQLQR